MEFVALLIIVYCITFPHKNGNNIRAATPLPWGKRASGGRHGKGDAPQENQRKYDHKTSISLLIIKHFQFRETINSDHRLKYLLDKFLSSTERLVELYEDKDGQRKAEVAALTGPNEFQEFYNRLKQIKDFYRKHPNEVYLLASF